MTSLNHRWTYAERRGNDPKLFLGNDHPGPKQCASKNTENMFKNGGHFLSRFGDYCFATCLSAIRCASKFILQFVSLIRGWYRERGRRIGRKRRTAVVWLACLLARDISRDDWRHQRWSSVEACFW